MRKWTLILFCLSVFFLGFVGATDSSCLEANQNFYGKKLCTLTVESSIDVEVGNNNYELSLISLDENEARIKVLNKDEEGGAKNPWEWTILEGEVNEYVDLIVKNEQTNSDNVEISIITSNCIQNECIFFHFHSVNIPEGNKIWAGFYDENEPTIGVDQESELFVQGEKKEVGNLEIILNKIEDYGYDYDYFTGEPSTAIKNIIISYSEIESIPEEEDIVETEEEGEEIEGCQNSDGNDVYIKGFVIDKYGNKEYDSCLSDERVVEGQCSTLAPMLLFI